MAACGNLPLTHLFFGRATAPDIYIKICARYCGTLKKLEGVCTRTGRPLSDRSASQTGQLPRQARLPDR